MPPTTVVILEDFDGDEFPVAFSGDLKNAYSEGELYEAAMARATPLIEAGELRPTMPLTLGGVEYPS